VGEHRATAGQRDLTRLRQPEGGPGDPLVQRV
jgi:hypothetical protein